MTEGNTSANGVFRIPSILTTKKLGTIPPLNSMMMIKKIMNPLRKGKSGLLSGKAAANRTETESAIPTTVVNTDMSRAI